MSVPAGNVWPMWSGRILAESLRVGADVVVPDIRLVRCGRHEVSDPAETQPAVWTYVDVEIPDNRADELADSLSRALLAEGGWYADFRSESEHIVIFSDRVFRYPHGDPAGRAAAVEYGLSVGVPARQLDWEV
jgi:hypothetical protein